MNKFFTPIAKTAQAIIHRLGLDVRNGCYRVNRRGSRADTRFSPWLLAKEVKDQIEVLERHTRLSAEPF